jgi:hypothetical protein
MTRRTPGRRAVVFGELLPLRHRVLAETQRDLVEDLERRDHHAGGARGLLDQHGVVTLGHELRGLHDVGREDAAW